MGRRKIEIQPITHERNRSVTFLKRKNGLFKKAYELGVLCSVDVAVIIFEERPGHHVKLYQYCSSDVNDIVQRHIRYDGEKDTRTPDDFSSSNAVAALDGDDDDDDEGDVPSVAAHRGKKPMGVSMSGNRGVVKTEFTKPGLDLEYQLRPALPIQPPSLPLHLPSHSSSSHSHSHAHHPPSSTLPLSNARHPHQHSPTNKRPRLAPSGVGVGAGEGGGGMMGPYTFSPTFRSGQHPQQQQHSQGQHPQHSQQQQHHGGQGQSQHGGQGQGQGQSAYHPFVGMVTTPSPASSYLSSLPFEFPTPTLRRAVYPPSSSAGVGAGGVGVHGPSSGGMGAGAGGLRSFAEYAGQRGSAEEMFAAFLDADERRLAHLSHGQHSHSQPHSHQSQHPGQHPSQSQHQSQHDHDHVGGQTQHDMHEQGFALDWPVHAAPAPAPAPAVSSTTTSTSSSGAGVAGAGAGSHDDVDVGSPDGVDVNGDASWLDFLSGAVPSSHPHPSSSSHPHPHEHPSGEDLGTSTGTGPSASPSVSRTGSVDSGDGGGGVGAGGGAPRGTRSRKRSRGSE